jgi:hypothetical protein
MTLHHNCTFLPIVGGAVTQGGLAPLTTKLLQEDSNYGAAASFMQQPDMHFKWSDEHFRPENARYIGGYASIHKDS